MAICYNCKEQFYGYYCPHCGKKAMYKCWNCKAQINPEETNKCKDCGWFECLECNQCGCHDDRPISNEEEQDYYDELILKQNQQKLKQIQERRQIK